MLAFSIIVCTYNRAAFLRDTLRSILHHLGDELTYELMVVDNNSKDQTAAVVREFADDPHIRYVLETRQGLSHARNRGIQEAKYPIIVFLDDDIELHPRYGAVLTELYSNPEVYIAGGKVLPYQTQIPDWLPKEFHYLTSTLDFGDAPAIVNKLLGANHSFRKEVAERVGDYNAEIGPIGDFKLGGDENEFLLRAQGLGYRIHYHPELIVYHKVDNRMNKAFILQYAYNIGASEANIDYTNQKGKMALKCLKYLANGWLNGGGEADGKAESVGKVIRREHNRGYLTFIRRRLSGEAGGK